MRVLSTFRSTSKGTTPVLREPYQYFRIPIFSNEVYSAFHSLRAIILFTQRNALRKKKVYSLGMQVMIDLYRSFRTDFKSIFLILLSVTKVLI